MHMGKKTNKTKKQHYVPRVYLKYFCERNKTINVFDKNQVEKFKANINDIACKNYFYDVDSNISEDEQIFEKKLSEFESLYEQELKNLFENLDKFVLKMDKNFLFKQDFNLSDKTKEYLAIFFLIQHFRTIIVRKTLAQISEQLYKKLEEFTGTKPSFEINDNEIKKSHIKLIFGKLKPLALYLQNQQWFILVNNTERPFYTSDNPAILDREFCSKDGRGKGIISYGMNFYLPLNPKYQLLIVEKSFYEKEFIKIRHKVPTVHKISEQSVIYANDLQLQNSYQQIYSNTNKYFFEEKDFCIENNINGNPNRPFIRCLS